ncbi:MAG TPA: hypothetical protein VLR92_12425, partial [Blastocatellia bacterium]|nr:hypothetical protein [Blastocatellia bacterium]
MTEFKVTRAHLKGAFDREDWDLLDKLLEIDLPAAQSSQDRPSTAMAKSSMPPAWPFKPAIPIRVKR